MGSSRITVRYRLTASTLWLGYWLLNGRRIRARLLIIMALIVCGNIATWTNSYFSIMLGLTFGLIIMGFICGMALRVKCQLSLREPTLAGELEMTADQDGLHGRSNTIDSNYDWSIFKDFVEDQYLFVMRVGKRMMFVIPKSAFSGEQDMEIFRSLARKHIQSISESKLVKKGS